MATTVKKSFKVNILGLFSLETDDLTFKQKFIMMLTVMLFVIIIIVLLRVYAIPVLGVTGAGSKLGGFLKIFKSRSP